MPTRTNGTTTAADYEQAVRRTEAARHADPDIPALIGTVWKESMIQAFRYRLVRWMVRRQGLLTVAD